MGRTHTLGFLEQRPVGKIGGGLVGLVFLFQHLHGFATFGGGSGRRRLGKLRNLFVQFDVDGLFLLGDEVVLGLVEGLDELDGLEVQAAALLALGREALLGDELLGVDHFRIAAFLAPAEGEFHLRVEVVGQVDELGSLGIGDEGDGRRS